MPAAVNKEKNNNKRTSSWDSKVSSMGSGKGRPYLRSDTPSSILSSDSDIRFTRKLGRPYRCSCYILTAFILLFLLMGLSLYLTYTYLSEGPAPERVFLGVLRVSEGDAFKPQLADPSSEKFRTTSRRYRDSINLWLRRSELRPAFIFSDVLAFDGRENEDLIVHFTVTFNMRRLEVSPENIRLVLVRESSHLGNTTIDSSSIKIQVFQYDANNDASTAPSRAEKPTSHPVVAPLRSCTNQDLSYCAEFTSNRTSYPNVIGHNTVEDVLKDVIQFRELVDSECYRLAQQFVCHLLQPPCSRDLILPCRSFCREFWSGCGSRMTPRLQGILNCTNFPEYSAERPACLSKPGCGDDLEYRGLGNRVCDGIADCPDLSDETSCSHCEPGNLHCTTSKRCVRPESVCDGVLDCEDGSDERSCLSLLPDMQVRQSLRSVQSKLYYAEGNVVFTDKGETGKLCIGNLNSTVEEGSRNRTLYNLASTLCRSLTFREVAEVKIEIDEDANSKYVVLDDPAASDIMFVPSSCPSREILTARCSNLECGLPAMRSKKGIEGLGKIALPGDWPWHIALFKSGTHICDGTLVAMNWVISTASCFQGQSKAEWIARAGSTRLASTSPWQQERHIIGMMKSPVEGSTVVLLKLDRKLIPSDFVRPICLQPSGSSIAQLTHCNTIGWAKERTMLQRVELKLSNMEQCANISITSVNSVCTDSFYGQDDCGEEELAGSPMMCLHPDGYRWVLAGVSNWRIACSKIGDQRPRLYDQTISNVEWIKSTMAGN
ncbi:SEA domain [Nesidiocoris tenuis]|uniref:SEA domain n=1 Tax=Nesidiocoris tenuis TaxID=355587 RepID=A0ABN7AZV5_9HEMI|nr:SEA domain [Nesidiocoris tenuis]